MSDLSHGRPLRVGIFGGTFNPIHCGHTRVARDVMRRYRLSSIHFIPSALPPHKTKGNLATAADRYEMTRMALADIPSFFVSDIEIQRSGPSFTIDTLRHFNASQPDDAQLFFIVGLDAFLEIHTWKAFRKLFDLAAFIVMSRPQGAVLSTGMRELAMRYAKEKISDAYALSASGDGEVLVHPQKQFIHLAPVTPVNISSSRIRELTRQGQSIRKWVARPVAEYIIGKGLYR